ncbi:MAG: sulfite exporter TauE/SafE family protein [Candidatus Methanoperedens sp.]|nr:sulfite exporter TauE/SafE family protein [Candidatus Methanoperedens sp.]
MELLLIILIAFSVAVIFSLLGLGGAIIYTPLFFWMGLPLLTAIPMALFLNAITTASASMTYLKQRMVNTRIAYPVITTSILGAFIGSYLARRVDTEIIVLLLSAVLFLASIRILFFNSIGILAGRTVKEKTAVGAVGGFLAGVISSLVGIGGGTFIVPLLLVLGFETKNAATTSAFIVTFISLSGFLGHLSVGGQQMDVSMLFYAGAAAFAGAQTGSRMIFNRTSSRTIERMFALVLLFVAGKLLYELM